MIFDARRQDANHVGAEAAEREGFDLEGWHRSAQTISLD
jgi:hypothetical protein